MKKIILEKSDGSFVLENGFLGKRTHFHHSTLDAREVQRFLNRLKEGDRIELVKLPKEHDKK